MTDDTPISEIDRTYRAYLAGLSRHQNAEDRSKWPYSREARQLLNACEQAKTKAIETFAAINGWKPDERTAYHPEAIGHRNRRYLRHADPLFDHCLNFRANGKDVSVVTQPYHYRDPNQSERWAAERGLAIHLPLDPLASIHYPGATYFIVIVAQGELVKWLSDQDGRLQERWQTRRETPAA